jgi:hypothetical protein
MKCKAHIPRTLAKTADSLVLPGHGEPWSEGTEEAATDRLREERFLTLIYFGRLFSCIIGKVSYAQ